MHLVEFQYAKALLMITTDKKISDIVYRDIENIVLPALKESSLNGTLCSLIVPLSTKLATIKNLFLGKVDETLLNLLLLVISNKRGIYLVRILQSFILQFETIEGVKRCTITTAVKFPNSMMEGLKAVALKMVKCKDLIVDHIIDESIIGGYIIFVDHMQLDCSIKSDLNRVKKLFTSTY